MIQCCSPSVNISILLDVFFVFEGLSIWKINKFMSANIVTSSLGEGDEYDVELNRHWQKTRRSEKCPTIGEQINLLAKSIKRDIHCFYLIFKKYAMRFLYWMKNKIQIFNMWIPYITCCLTSMLITLYYAGYFPEKLRIQNIYLSKIIGIYMVARVIMFFLSL